LQGKLFYRFRQLIMNLQHMNLPQWYNPALRIAGVCWTTALILFLFILLLCVTEFLRWLSALQHIHDWTIMFTSRASAHFMNPPHYLLEFRSISEPITCTFSAFSHPMGSHIQGETALVSTIRDPIDSSTPFSYPSFSCSYLSHELLHMSSRIYQFSLWPLSYIIYETIREIQVLISTIVVHWLRDLTRATPTISLLLSRSSLVYLLSLLFNNLIRQ
jgi:hypothetical protein